MSEWKSARLLAEAGIPCVEYLACASSHEGELLVSREWTGGVQADAYLDSVPPASEESVAFCRSLARLTGNLLHSGLIHPDFHTGNILYRPESGELALVDVYGVARRHFWSGFLLRSRPEDILLNAPQSLPLSFILELYSLALPEEEPNRRYEASVRRRLRWLAHDWPKRRRQILSAYPKFTERRDAWLVRRGTDFRRAFETAERIQGDPARLETAFLNTFRLRLAGIPCQKALAFNREDGIILLEPGTPFTAKNPPDAAWTGALARGLDIHPDAETLCVDSQGTVKLKAIP